MPIRQYANGNDETPRPEAHLRYGTIQYFRRFRCGQINWIKPKTMLSDAGGQSLKKAQIASAASLYSVAGLAAYTPRLNWNVLSAPVTSVNITLVTRDNYFLFTPMLHEVAASDLEMNTIVNPLRKMLRRVKTFTGNIEKINLERRCVTVTHGFDRHVHELPVRPSDNRARFEHEFLRPTGSPGRSADYQDARRRDRIEEPSDHASRGSELGVRGRRTAASADVCGSGGRFRWSRNARRDP